MSNYALAKRLGKAAPQVMARGKELKLGERPRRNRKRKCVRCQEPFVPEDWTTDWYCEKHKKQMAHMTDDLTATSAGSGRVLPKFANV